MCHVRVRFPTSGLAAATDSLTVGRPINLRSGSAMTTDLTMLAWTAGLTLLLAFPYVLATIQRYGVMDALTYRADGKPLDDWATRAKKAHYNAIENLAPFAALVIVAHLTNSANDATAAADRGHWWRI